MDEHQESETTMHPLRVFYRMWTTFPKKFPILFTSAFMFSLLMAGLPFVLSKIQGSFVDNLINNLRDSTASITPIYQSLIVLVICFLVIAVADFVNDYIINVRLFYSIHTSSMKLMMEKKGKLDLSFFDNPSNMTMLHHADDAQNIITAHFKFSFLSLITSFVSFVVSIWILGTFSWVLVSVVFLALLPFVYVLYQSSTEEVRRWKSKTLLKKFTGDVRKSFESTHTLTEIKIFGIAKKMTDRFINFRNIIDGELIEISKKYLYLKMVGSAIRYAGMGIAIVLLVQSTLSGDTTVGQTTFYLATVLAFGNATQSLFTNLARARQELMQISSVFEFLDVVPAFSDNGEKLGSYNKAPSIAFKNVSFGYSPDKQIIKNIDFEIKPGEKVALVGLNGAGKSTIVKLLCRVYDPQSGEVLIDGMPLSEINPDSWYQNLSVVFQDYGRYEFTVEESIAIGERGKIDEERVRRSAVMAQIDEKIQSFPEGYKNQLGTKFPGGVGLSVGQWQKIAIARALYRQSRVIILDEPTSSIDADAEEEIFNTLHNLGEDTTLIFVSHRFSTIRQADKIVFIAGGTVDCVGSHDYLIENSSEYKRLYEMQSKAYSE